MFGWSTEKTRENKSRRCLFTGFKFSGKVLRIKKETSDKNVIGAFSMFHGISFILDFFHDRFGFFQKNVGHFSLESELLLF